MVHDDSGAEVPDSLTSNPATTRDVQNRVIAGNVNAFFNRLMRAIGRYDLADDPQLARNDGRARRADGIDGAIQRWCDTRTIDQALEVLRRADVPVGKIYSVADMFADPQFIARGMIEQHRFPDGSPVKLDRQRVV